MQQNTSHNNAISLNGLVKHVVGTGLLTSSRALNQK